MADNVAITAGSGTNVAADERTINSTTVFVQRVGEIGSTAIASGQVAPTSTAATLLAARETRKRVTFVNRGSVSVWVGPATVTSANGLEIKPGESYVMYSTALIQAITASATGAVQYLEEYDS